MNPFKLLWGWFFPESEKLKETKISLGESFQVRESFEASKYEVLLSRIARCERSIDASGPSLRIDIANFEQRLDALCQVCGVEVVITDGEVFTKRIAREYHSEESAARWALVEHMEQLEKTIRKSLAELRTAEERLKAFDLKRSTK